MAMNYYKVIRALLGFRDRLSAFRTAKNAPIVKYFEENDFDLEDEDANTPDIKEISAQTKVPRSKVSPMLRDLYLKALETFRIDPLVIKKSVVTVSISLHWEELKNTKNNEFAEELRQKTLEISVDLPSIPRIGETISFDFIDDEVSWNYGHVYAVKHEISEGTQRVIVFAHPFENYYYEWKKLKTKYERDIKRRTET